MTNNDIIEEYLKGSIAVADLLMRLGSEVDECNLALSDLDHFLELEDLDDHQLATLQKLRKCTLESRRRGKDTIRVIDQILPRQIEGRTTSDRYEYAIRNMEHRVYTPRVLTIEQVLG